MDVKGKKAMAGIFLISIGIAVAFAEKSADRKYSGKLQKAEILSRKHWEMVKMYDRWITVKQRGRSVADYLTEQGYHSVAIYGMGVVGETLYDELKNTDVSVKYAIDKNAPKMFHDEIEVVSPDDELGKVDLIIVTSNFYFYEIEAGLREKTDMKIANFEDLLYEV